MPMCDSLLYHCEKCCSMGVMRIWSVTHSYLLFYFCRKAMLAYHFAFTHCILLCLMSQAVVANQHTRMYIPGNVGSQPPSQIGECVLMKSICSKIYKVKFIRKTLFHK